MKEKDDWNSVSGLSVFRREPVFMTYDEWGMVQILSGIPTIEEYESIKKEALEYAKICRESRQKVFEAECELYKNSKTANNFCNFYYSSTVIILSLLILLIILLGR